MVEMLDNYSLYEFIDRWIGVKYQYGGKDENGIDCSAFTGRLFSDLYKMTLPRTSSEQYENSEPVDLENLKEGDLLFFNTSGKSISHVGVFLGNGKFVHASTNKGVTIDDLDWPYYQKTFIGAGRPFTFTN
jgi:lipoprotein Spr